MKETINRLIKSMWRVLSRTKPYLALLAAAAAGFAAAGCIWMQDLRVGVLAVTAACSFWGLPVGGAALGAALGLLVQGSEAWIRLPSVAVLLALLLATRHAGWGKSVWARLAMMTLAQAVTLFFLQGQGFMMILLGLETLGAWGVTMALMGAGGHVTRVSPLTAGNAAICLTVSVALLASGLPGVYEGPWAPCMLVMAVAVMAAGTVGGPSVGAAAGLALGALAALAGRTPWAAAGAMGMGAMTAAALSGLGRPFSALGFALGLCALAVLEGVSPLAVIPYPAMITACLAFAVVPKAWWERAMVQLIEPAVQTAAPAATPLEEAGTKIRNLSGCLRQLSTVFLEMAVPDDTQQGELLEPLLQTVASQACQGCARAKLCWDTQQAATRQAFIEALQAPGERRVIWEEDFPMAFRARCPRMHKVMGVMTGAYGLYRAHSGYHRRIDECRALVGRQLTGMAAVMDNLAGEMRIRLGPVGDKQRMVRQTLREAGLDPQGVAVTQDGSGRWTVALQVTSCGGRKMCRTVIAPLLSRILARPMLPEEGSCGGVGGMCQLIFRQARVFKVDSGAAQQAAGAVCGDAMMHRALERSGFLMAISDGMGIGSGAAQEAQATLKLLECFYEAGFEEDVIFHTINQVLLLRSVREMYATVDLCLVDITEGQARFIKIGAPPSYILRGEEVIVIATPTLPLGILDNVEPATINRVLQDGDVLVLASDGLEGGNGWIEQVLPSIGHLPPEDMAQALLEASRQWAPGADDRSVVVARVSCPEQDEIAYFKRQRLQLWKARVGT